MKVNKCDGHGKLDHAIAKSMLRRDVARRPVTHMEPMGCEERWLLNAQANNAEILGGVGHV
jgi:hypothetical protein